MRYLSAVVRLLVAICLFMGVAAMSRGQCVEDWRVGMESALPGVDGKVYAFAVHDDGRGSAVYIGGEFDIAGNVYARNIARWDGKNWEAVGAGLDDPVRALASYNGELVAGGEGFTLPGTVNGQSLARYTPSGWAFFPVGTMDSRVSALLVHDGQLYVGGNFRSPVFPSAGDRLTAWNGSGWVRVTSDLTTPDITALTAWNGKVVAGSTGRFGFGTQVSEGVALLNGGSWVPLAGGVSHDVNALTVYNGELIAGGNFTQAGGSAISRVARWDGISWKAVGAGLGATSGEAFALAVHDGQLFVGGDFVGGITGGESFLLRWDGSWHSEMSFVYAGSGLAEAIYALTPFEDRLMAGGGFDRLGTWIGYSLTAWRDGKFGRVTGALTYPVEQLYDDGGELLAMGQALDQTSGIARLDESVPGEPRWVGDPSAEFSSTTRAVIRYGGRLVVGGMFTRVNGTTVNLIARQGELIGWEGMGAGFNKPGSFPAVTTLAEYRGELIAGGSFTMSGTTVVNRIARWDGSAWQPMGLGLDGSPVAMIVLGDELIVGGAFTTAGGEAALNIAAWNGTSWRGMGSGLDGTVQTLEMFEGSLIAGGRFRSTEPGGLSGVARWDGSAWQPMGEGIIDWISALGVHQGQLMAGGSRLWRWNGEGWIRLGSVGRAPTMPHVVLVSINSLMSRGGELLVAGAFTGVNGEPGSSSLSTPVALFYARWGCAPCKADMDGDGVVDFADYLTFLNLFDAQDPAADLNGDGIVDFPDYLEFLDAFASGCA